VLFFVVSPNSKPNKKAKTNSTEIALIEKFELEKWPEIPLKKIGEVTLALLNEMVRYLLLLFRSNMIHNRP
jgi:hypothetical protein